MVPSWFSAARWVFFPAFQTVTGQYSTETQVLFQQKAKTFSTKSKNFFFDHDGLCYAWNKQGRPAASGRPARPRRVTSPLTPIGPPLPRLPGFQEFPPSRCWCPFGKVGVLWVGVLIPQRNRISTLRKSNVSIWVSLGLLRFSSIRYFEVVLCSIDSNPFSNRPQPQFRGCGCCYWLPRQAAARGNRYYRSSKWGRGLPSF